MLVSVSAWPSEVAVLGPWPSSGMALLTPDELLRHPVFASLGTTEAERLLDQQRPLSAAADQTLLLFQDEGEGPLLIQSGLAKVRAFAADGSEVVMAVLGPGDLFGDMAVLLGGVRSADVVALTPLEAVRLMARPFRELLHEDARLALALARLQAERLKVLNQRFLLRGSDATTRLLAVLLDLAYRCSAGADPLALIPSLPQRELAAMAGLSRETTSRSFSQLRQRGLIEADAAGIRLLQREPLQRRGLLGGL